MGRFGGKHSASPQNNPTVTWAVTLDPGHHSFSKWAIVSFDFPHGLGLVKTSLSWLWYYYSVNKPPPGLLEFKSMSKKLPWNIIMLLGSGFALAEACKVNYWNCNSHGRMWNRIDLCHSAAMLSLRRIKNFVIARQVSHWIRVWARLTV